MGKNPADINKTHRSLQFRISSATRVGKTPQQLLATALYYYAFAKGTALLPSSVAGMLSGAIPLFAFLRFC